LFGAYLLTRPLLRSVTLSSPTAERGDLKHSSATFTHPATLRATLSSVSGKEVWKVLFNCVNFPCAKYNTALQGFTEARNAYRKIIVVDTKK